MQGIEMSQLSILCKRWLWLSRESEWLRQPTAHESGALLYLSLSFQICPHFLQGNILLSDSRQSGKHGGKGKEATLSPSSACGSSPSLELTPWDWAGKVPEKAQWQLSVFCWTYPNRVSLEMDVHLNSWQLNFENEKYFSKHYLHNYSKYVPTFGGTPYIGAWDWWYVRKEMWSQGSFYGRSPCIFIWNGN